MKKILLSLILVLVLTCCAYAETFVGMLRKANASEEEYQELFANAEFHDKLILSQVYADGVKTPDLRIRFYNSTLSLIHI